MTDAVELTALDRFIMAGALYVQYRLEINTYTASQVQEARVRYLAKLIPLCHNDKKLAERIESGISILVNNHHNDVNELIAQQRAIRESYAPQLAALGIEVPE